jgi:hypothetical protein
MLRAVLFVTHFICGRCKIPFLTLSKCAPINLLLANYTVSLDDAKIWCLPFHRIRRPSFAKLRCSRIQRPNFPISHRNKLFWKCIHSWMAFFCAMSMNLTPTSFHSTIPTSVRSGVGQRRLVIVDIYIVENSGVLGILTSSANQYYVPFLD